MLKNSNKRIKYKYSYDEYYKCKSRLEISMKELNDLNNRKFEVESRIKELECQEFNLEIIRKNSVDEYVCKLREEKNKNLNNKYTTKLQIMNNELSDIKLKIENELKIKTEYEAKINELDNKINSLDFRISGEIKDKFGTLFHQQDIIEANTDNVIKIQGHKYLNSSSGAYDFIPEVGYYEIATTLLENPEIKVYPVHMELGESFGPVLEIGKMIFSVFGNVIKFIPKIFLPPFFKKIRSLGIRIIIQFIYIMICGILLIKGLDMILPYLLGSAGLAGLGVVSYSIYIVIVNHMQKQKVQLELNKFYVLNSAVMDTDNFVNKISAYVKNNEEFFSSQYKSFSDTDSLINMREELINKLRDLDSVIEELNSKLLSKQDEISTLKNDYEKNKKQLLEDIFTNEVNEFLDKLDNDLNAKKYCLENEKTLKINKLNSEITELNKEISLIEDKIKTISLEKENFNGECTSLKKVMSQFEEELDCNNYVLDESFLLGFKAANITGEPDSLIEINHQYKPIVILYSNAMKLETGNDEIKSKIGKFINRIIINTLYINNFQIVKQHFIDTEFGGIMFSSHELLDMDALTICKNDDEIKKLIDTITTEKQAIDNIKDVNLKRAIRGDSPEKYEILYMFAYGSMLKNQSFKQLLKNNKEKGIIPVIFMAREDIKEMIEKSAIDSDMLSLLNEVNKNNSAYSFDITKDITKEDDYCIKYNLDDDLKLRKEKIS